MKSRYGMMMGMMGMVCMPMFSCARFPNAMR